MVVDGPLIAPLSPEMAELMQAYRALGAPSYAAVGVDESRARYRRATAGRAWEPLRPVTTTDHAVPGARVRVYSTDTPLRPGVIIYFHGGGFVMGDLDTHDSVCRELAAAACLPVVAVDYPLAPEHPFPAAPDFAIDVVRLIEAEAATWGVDASRIALVGDSAGACLCALVGMDLRVGSKILAQCLFYPPTDMHCDTASFREISSGYPVTGADGVWFTARYLGADGSADDPRASPLLADSLSTSPPTMLVTAGHDPLRDEGLAYAARLTLDGVDVTHVHLAGHVHGFLTSGGAVPEVRALLEASATFITSSFARHEEGIRS